MSWPDNDSSAFLTGSIDQDRRTISDFFRIAFISLRSGHPALSPLRSWSIELGDTPALRLSRASMTSFCPGFRSTDREAFAFYQIAKGMAYLHSLDIIHWGVQPDDLWFGLGCSTRFRFRFWFPDEPERYQAPELAHGLSYTKACDVYSAGALFYELSTGATFSENSPIPAPDFPTFCEDMLNPDPARRPTFEAICFALKPKLPASFEGPFVPPDLDLPTLLADMEAAVFRERDIVEMVVAGFASLPGLCDLPLSEDLAVYARGRLRSEKRLWYRSIPPDDYLEPASGDDSAVVEQALLSFCESLADIPTLDPGAGRIGSGTYGEVYQLRWSPGGNPEDFAVKLVPMRPWQTYRAAPRVVAMCFRQMAILKMCAHPAILTAHFWQLNPHREEGEMQIVTELMRGGCLYDRIRALTPTQQTIVAYGIA
jgi:serine/threonine protein kinase